MMQGKFDHDKSEFWYNADQDVDVHKATAIHVFDAIMALAQNRHEIDVQIFATIRAEEDPSLVFASLIIGAREASLQAMAEEQGQSGPMEKPDLDDYYGFQR
jgi:hypothetical protein